jgi:hypothetical protein
LRPVEVHQPSAVPRPASGESTPWRNVSVQELITVGLITPPLELEKTYLKQLLRARLEADGRVTYAGETYSSLSIAGGVARASIVGTPSGRKYLQTNGWIFWQFRDKDGQLKRVDVLRQRYFERNAATGAQ